MRILTIALVIASCGFAQQNPPPQPYTLPVTVVAQKWFGTAAPGVGNIPGGNLPGDLFYNTAANPVAVYICGAPQGTPAPACTTLSATGWSLVNVASLPPSGTAGGGLGGTYPNPSVNVSALNQVLSYLIAAWGDSLTAGVGGGVNTYPLYLQTDIPGSVTFNEGVGGYTSSQCLTAFNALPSTYNYTTIIWCGRNNFTSQAQVLSDIAAMVAQLPTPKRFLVLSIINGQGGTSVNTSGNEWTGQTGYNQIVALNAALKAAYPNNYFDIRTYLISQATGSADDVLDVANDTVPTSLHTTSTLVSAATLGAAITTTNTCASNNITLTYSKGNIQAGQIITVDSEQIFLTTVSGASTITVCTRGYAGTTTATHLNGATVTVTDALHLNAAGYALVATQVANFITTSLNLSTAPVSYSSLSSVFASPGYIGLTTPGPGSFSTLVAPIITGNSALTGTLQLIGPSGTAGFTPLAGTQFYIDNNSNGTQVLGMIAGTSATQVLCFAKASSACQGQFTYKQSNDYFNWIGGGANLLRLSGAGVAAFATGGVVGFSGVTFGTADTGLSRDSAGVVDVGTGAAANASGTVKAATVIIGNSSFTFNGHTCTIVSTVVTCP